MSVSRQRPTVHRLTIVSTLKARSNVCRVVPTDSDDHTTQLCTV